MIEIRITIEEKTAPVVQAQERNEAREIAEKLYDLFEQYKAARKLCKN